MTRWAGGGTAPPAHRYAGGAMNTSESADGERGDTERLTWIERRRAKIRDEIARNRRGEYTVPTWVLAVALVAIVGGWLALIFLVG